MFMFISPKLYIKINEITKIDNEVDAHVRNSTSATALSVRKVEKIHGNRPTSLIPEGDADVALRQRRSKHDLRSISS